MNKANAKVVGLSIEVTGENRHQAALILMESLYELGIAIKSINVFDGLKEVDITLSDRTAAERARGLINACMRWLR